ncbi:unnamed protein product [Allacma fusca]|uniref:GAS2-like protein 1 n=1 Tax=Allacma fusca TaxID=39272 RepID=A0A8J2K2J1_9HEXA|nr:unnamed protein product [Allacma fusca]
MERMLISEDLIRPQMLQLREFRPFKNCDEYLWAMREDLSDWLNTLYPELSITPQNFMECLETGVTLCKHANNVRVACIEWMNSGKKLPKCWGREWKMPNGEITFNANARPETFFARDNVHNFISWCRKLGIFDCLLFESDDLILRKNEKSFILCLLEVARRGSHFGMAAPLLVQFEKEIDRDIAKDTGQDLSSSGEEEESFQEHEPRPQIITNDLRSLDEMVRDLVERCTCPTQFPMIRIAEGKYRIGNTKLMIYVRILRNHVMVRVGGGWTTLGAFLARHDPCRHKTTVSSKFIMKNDGSLPKMKVEYERRDLSFEPVAHSTPAYSSNKKSLDLSDSSSEISDEGYKTSDNLKILLDTPKTSVVQNCKDISTKGHLSRKCNAIRARSLSTDEERPDSRSTDEEVGHSHTPERDGRVLKSNSSSLVNKVPTRPTSREAHARSMSCERPNRGPPGSFRQRYVSGENTGVVNKQSNYGHKRTNSTGSPKKSPLTDNQRKTITQAPPTRSLSAGGTVEFYKNNTPSNRYMNNRTGRNIGGTASATGFVSSAGSNRIPGKNTWNGPNTPRRQRANLFQAPFFGPGAGRGEHSVSRTAAPHDSVDNLSEDLSNDCPDLAMWIKKALELDQDADKISHIELAIKQFEEQREKSPEHKSTSLPYSVNDSATNNLTQQQKQLPIRKRNDKGITKIPKPNFY